MEVLLRRAEQGPALVWWPDQAGGTETCGKLAVVNPASRRPRHQRLSNFSSQLLPALTVATGAAISSALGASSRLLAAAAACPRLCDCTSTRRASRGRALTARGAPAHTVGRVRLLAARLRVSAGAAIFVLLTVKGNKDVSSITRGVGGVRWGSASDAGVDAVSLGLLRLH